MIRIDKKKPRGGFIPKPGGPDPIPLMDPDPIPVSYKPTSDGPSEGD
jgi:hypothetical protein